MLWIHVLKYLNNANAVYCDGDESGFYYIHEIGGGAQCYREVVVVLAWSFIFFFLSFHRLHQADSCCFVQSIF
jgi:hypothetical protein